MSHPHGFHDLLLMKRSSQSPIHLALGLALALAGCDLKVLNPILSGTASDSSAMMTETGTSAGAPDPGTTSSPTTSGGTTSGGTTSGDTTSGETSDATACGNDSNDSAAFIVPPDPPAQCDVWAQDCPAGQKCSAQGPPPLGSDNIECVPIVPDPDQAGEPCKVLVECALGPDTCDFGMICRGVDPDTGFGTCLKLCQGSESDPVCDPGYLCLLADVPMCLATCDPLLQDCPAGESCQDVGDFACFDILPPPGEGTFEGCAGSWQCAPGHVCVSPEGAVECDQNDQDLGCCSPYCDMNAPDCPGVGQVCLPYDQFDDLGLTPAGHENLGVCHRPM